MTDPTTYSLAELNAHLAESEQDVLLGRTVPMEHVLGRLRATIARMEARRNHVSEVTSQES